MAMAIHSGAFMEWKHGHRMALKRMMAKRQGLHVKKKSMQSMMLPTVKSISAQFLACSCIRLVLLWYANHSSSVYFIDLTDSKLSVLLSLES